MSDITRTRADADAVALELPFSPESASVARQHLVRWMQQLHTHPDDRDDARLVMSELVGNAVRHARPLANDTLQISWATNPSGLNIAVTDGGARTAPEKVSAGVTDLDGRGLAIVEALAECWWVESTTSHSTVHAVLVMA